MTNRLVPAGVLAALLAVLCLGVLASCGQDAGGQSESGDAVGVLHSSVASGSKNAAKEYAATVEHVYSTEVDPDAGYRHVTPEEAVELMQQEGSILVDVRGEVDWDYIHIPGSIPIAFNVITGEEGRKLLPDKDQLIILYCDYGGMSKIAAEDLVYAGYTNVVEFNGLEVWDGPVEGDYLRYEDSAAESGQGDVSGDAAASASKGDAVASASKGA